MKLGSSNRNLRSVSANLLYNGQIVDDVSIFLGGGGLIFLQGTGFGLNGYARLDMT